MTAIQADTGAAADAIRRMGGAAKGAAAELAQMSQDLRQMVSHCKC